MASVFEEETLPESMITDLQALRQYIIGPVQN
jgi:hypothetical protein